MEKLLIVFVVLVIAFIVITRFIEETTVKLIFQIVLGAALLWVVLRYAGAF